MPAAAARRETRVTDRQEIDRVRQALRSWVQAGWLREIDAQFAEFVARQAAPAEALLMLAAAWVSHQVGRGHPALDLEAVCADPQAALGLPPPDGEAAGSVGRDGDPASPSPESPAVMLQGLSALAWAAVLRRSAAVDPGVTRQDGASERGTPLVLTGCRLQLRRFWRAEHTIGRALLERLSTSAVVDDAGARALLRRALDALFPPPAVHPTSAARGGLSAPPGPDVQKVACAVAVRQPFAVITGGPGTGKTTTVVRLLALLQHLALQGRGVNAPRALRIGLAAPTGKAAARLSEAINQAVDRLDLDRLGGGDGAGVADLSDAIPTAVSTLHRLLGMRGNTRRPVHNARHPLDLDVLVIDEASMVDLEMLAAVCEALPAEDRLILLGDKDQLASVEPGGVLGGLCERAEDGHYALPTREWIESVTGQTLPDHWVDPSGRPLDQAVVMLRHSHRFDAGSGIGRLAAAVHRGDAEGALQGLREGGPDLAWVDVAPDGMGLRGLVLNGRTEASPRHAAPGDIAAEGAVADAAGGYRHYLEVMHQAQPEPDAPAAAFDAWARQVLQAFSRFQLLCALRRGPAGVERLNERIAQWLHESGWLPPPQGWYAGRPVLVTRNDPTLQLVNGDVGVTLAAPSRAAGALRVAFAVPEQPGAVRWLLPSRLRDVETAFALTVHKSQGSEFDHAALVLPDRPHAVLTRALIYTAITRSRSRFTLAASSGGPAVFAAAVRELVDAAPSAWTTDPLTTSSRA